jgi:hypothetical protein
LHAQLLTVRSAVDALVLHVYSHSHNELCC